MTALPVSSRFLSTDEASVSAWLKVDIRSWISKLPSLSSDSSAETASWNLALMLSIMSWLDFSAPSAPSLALPSPSREKLTPFVLISACVIMARIWDSSPLEISLSRTLSSKARCCARSVFCSLMMPRCLSAPCMASSLALLLFIWVTVMRRPIPSIAMCSSP